MKKREKEELLREFEQSFATYIRMTGGEPTDGRPEAVTQLLAQSATVVIEVMEAHDLAAILSGLAPALTTSQVRVPLSNGNQNSFLLEINTFK